MSGLFEELGPCFINNQSTGVNRNPTSWTEVANVYVFHYPQLYFGLLSSCLDYSLTSPSELASRTETQSSVRLGKPLRMCGVSYKYGLRIRDSASTPVKILESGHQDPLALYLQRASHSPVVFIPLTVGACRYFLQKNAEITFGTLKGIYIKLKVLGIGNGLTVWRSVMPRWLTCC